MADLSEREEHKDLFFLCLLSFNKAGNWIRILDPHQPERKKFSYKVLMERPMNFCLFLVTFPININLKIIIFIQVFTFPHSLTKYWRTLPPGTGCCRSPHNADMDPHH